MKTSELIGPALDWVVAKCNGDFALYHNIEEGQRFLNLWTGSAFLKYSTLWSCGGPIIEREKIDLEFMDNFEAWCGSVVREYGQDRESYSDDQDRDSYTVEQESFVAYGPTPLIAAMRVFVASRLGNEVDVPEELAALVKGE